MFGRKKNAFATYSKSKPVQIATKDHFPTPETPDDLWIPSSKDKPNSKQAAFPPVKAKGLKTWMTPFAGRGSSLALRNISNIPLEKTLSRTPCMPSQNSYKTNRKLMSSSALLGKVSSNDDKDCKTYRKELQRAKLHSKKAPLMKSKPLTSTTTYSFKSMSSCSMCGSVVYSNERSLPTVKSMSLCKSCLDDVSSDDFSFGDAPTSASQVLQPHNSTLLEEDLTIQLRDIIPQDLSAIMEEPVDEKEQAEAAQKKTEDALGSYDLFDKEEIADAPDLPRCSTPVDPGKIQGLKLPDTSAITVYNEKTSDPVKSKSKSKNQEPESSKEDLPNVTPETVSKQDCITMKKLKQKRKLAYSKDLDEIPDCTLLHANTNRKRPIKLLFKCDKSTCSYSSPLTNVPIDTLIQSSVDKIKIRIEQ